MSEIRITAENGVINIEGAGSANQLLNLLNIAAASVIAKSALSTEDPFGIMEEELSVFDKALTETSIREIGRLTEMDKPTIDKLVENYFRVSDTIEALIEGNIDTPEETEIFEVPKVPLRNGPVNNVLDFVERTKADTKANKRKGGS